jgi:heme-degrading monooxygenase HmoA
MYLVFWEYHVKVERVSKFEEIYAAQGAWARLFQKHPGYPGTELLRDSKDPQRYLTIDRWTSAEAYNSFRAEWQDEYKKLDERCDSLTDREASLSTLHLV